MWSAATWSWSAATRRRFWIFWPAPIAPPIPKDPKAVTRYRRINDEKEIEIDWDKDIREETMRAGGAGGQHVNKTESAVRLVHLATGVEAKCDGQEDAHRQAGPDRRGKARGGPAASYQSTAKFGGAPQRSKHAIFRRRRAQPAAREPRGRIFRKDDRNALPRGGRDIPISRRL